MPLSEKLLRWAAGCVGAVASWLGDRARSMKTRRMEALWPPGTRVRLSCECNGPLADHQGEWFVVSYAEDAGDYRLARQMPTAEAPLFSGTMTYAVAGAFQRFPAGRAD